MIQAIPITGPDKKVYDAHLDTQATISVIPPEVANKWTQAGAKKTNANIRGRLANGSPFHANQTLETNVVTELRDVIRTTFAVMPTPNKMILLGVPALNKQLPVVFRYAGRTIFEGCPPVQVVATAPTHQVGDGVPMAAGTPAQQDQIRQLLIKYKDNIFEWSGKFGLFADYYEDIPLTSQEPIHLKPYRIPLAMQKPFGDIMEEYVERKIVEPANSPYSSPAFLAPKPHADPNDIASKVWRLCCDYRQINDLT